MEEFIVSKIRDIGKDSELVAEAIKAAGKEIDTRRPELISELRKLERERKKLETKRENYLDAIGKGGTATQAVLDRLGEADSGLQRVSHRVEHVRSELSAMNDEAINEDDLKQALAQFTPVWTELTLAEKSRIVQRSRCRSRPDEPSSYWLARLYGCAKSITGTPGSAYPVSSA